MSTKTPKYAPAREDGTKPYVVTVAWRSSRDSSDRLVYTLDRINATYRATNGHEQGSRIAACRRASPEDVTNLREHQ